MAGILQSVACQSIKNLYYSHTLIGVVHLHVNVFNGNQQEWSHQSFETSFIPRPTRT